MSHIHVLGSSPKKKVIAIIRGPLMIFCDLTAESFFSPHINFHDFYPPPHFNITPYPLPHMYWYFGWPLLYIYYDVWWGTYLPCHPYLHNIKRIVLVGTQGSRVKKCVVLSCGEYPYVVVPHCCVHLCRILTVSYLAILNFHVVSKYMVQDYYGEFSMCRILRES